MARRSESSGSPSPPAEPLPLTMPQARTGHQSATATQVRVSRQRCRIRRPLCQAGRRVPRDAGGEQPVGRRRPIGRDVQGTRGEFQRLSELRLGHDVRRRHVRRSRESDRSDTRQGEGRDARDLDARSSRDQGAHGRHRETPHGRQDGRRTSFDQPQPLRPRTDDSGRRSGDRRPGHRRLPIEGDLRRQPLQRARYSRENPAQRGPGDVREAVRPAVADGPRSDPEEPQADPCDARHPDRVGGREGPARRDRRATTSSS